MLLCIFTLHKITELDTDEDSGDNEDVQLTNLPGKQMTSHATTNQAFSTFSPPISKKKKKKKLRHWCAEDFFQKNDFHQL